MANSALVMHRTEARRRFPMPMEAIGVLNNSFRLLDLPPEIRLHVYRYILAPTGTISLRSDGLHHHLRVVPGNIKPGILRTCRTVYHEAKDILYHNNTVCLTVETQFCNTNMIHPMHMSGSGLAKLKSVLLFFDTVNADAMTIDMYSNTNWRQIQAMTGLQKATISVIEHSSHSQHRQSLMRHVVERLPASCNIRYTTSSAAEEDHLNDLKERIEKAKFHSRPGATFQIADGQELKQAAAEYLDRQGAKSGHTRDYRWPERKPLKLNTLVDESSIDPANVLGCNV